ncbi:hypothetical protein Ciccas_010152 [Cichlidogyrus casuarinus]|uniref:FLYWCH-type domain-containing protein n=1 Tax=Cichlidogyrus casuarinus TaxID=1844966 RepID=A0ABD2PW13_9PLAT
MFEWLKVAHSTEILDQDLLMEPDYVVDLDVIEDEEEPEIMENALVKPSVPDNPERIPKFGQHDHVRFIYRPKDGPNKRPLIAFYGRTFSYKDYAQSGGKTVGWRWQCSTKNCWTTLQTDLQYQVKTGVIQHKNFCLPQLDETEIRYLEGFICMAARHAPSTDHKQIYNEFCREFYTFVNYPSIVQLASFKDNHPEYTHSHMKSFTAMASQLSRSHAGLNRNEFGEIELQGDFLTRVGSRPNSPRFLLYVKKINDERLIIYASDFYLEHLADAQIWMADGTFKAASLSNKNFGKRPCGVSRHCVYDA